MPPSFVVVGANLAGGTAAAVLREQGFDGRLVLIGDEPDPPYERPPLSKAYLRSERDFESSFVRPPAFYNDNQIDTLFSRRATRVDPAERIVELSDGERITYDRLLIATGGRNRRLEVPGAGLDGVFDLRTRSDADRIRAAVPGARRVGVVGMGFIGAEVAASLRTLGLDVTVVEIFPAPLFKVLGQQIGEVVERVHRDHGVRMLFEDAVEGFEGSGRVERIRTRSGRTIECDFVVVGVGIEPATDVAAGSPIEIDNGIVVDEFCLTNLPDVFAAGDVANHFHPVHGARMRVEHWQNAIRQAEVAAKNMLGRNEPYEEPHWFWSDQFDCNIQYAGHLEGWDEVVIRGNPEDRNFVAFYMQKGRLKASVGINRGRDVRQSIRLIKAGEPIDPILLRDENIPVRDLAKAT